MGGMKWEKANKRDVVRERGGEYAFSGFDQNIGTPKKSQRKGKKRRAKSNPCPITKEDHFYGLWSELSFPHDSKVRTCHDCGFRDIKPVGRRSNSGPPSIKRLEQRLARLQKRPNESIPREKLITSRRDPTSSRTKGKSSSSQQSTFQSLFDPSIHRVHQKENDPYWTCYCSWIGSRVGDKVRAQHDHRTYWHSKDQNFRVELDIEAIQNLLLVLKPRSGMPRDSE